MIPWLIPREVPKGIIAMWKGTIATIPAGWALCNGGNGTPDLRDRFVVGAKQDHAGVAKTNLTGSLTQSGGAANHNHAISIYSQTGYADVYDAGHAHYTSYYYYINLWEETNYEYCWDANEQSDIGYADLQTGGHDHDITGNTGNQSAQPPYFALAYIMKL